MTLTLEDIAHLSNVSRSTVSRVINGDQNVNQETRNRVLEIISIHNYQPNIAARRLAAGKTNVIGLVLPTGVNNIFMDPYFAPLIQAIAARCNQKDHSIMLWLAEPEYERRTIHKIIHNGLVDGVIVASTLHDDPLVTTIFESKFPFVMIGHHPKFRLNSIDIDNKKAAFQATIHLLDCSPACQRPASIIGPQNILAGQERLAGFQAALAAKGFPFQPAMIADGSFSETGGYNAMKQLLPANPDAVFAASDSMAAGAYRAIRKAGLHIPGDIKIIGFDDLAIASQLDPPLTTIRQPIRAMGYQAVELLLTIIQQPNTAPQQIILQPELIIRSSSGCGSSSVII